MYSVHVEVYSYRYVAPDEFAHTYANVGSIIKFFFSSTLYLFYKVLYYLLIILLQFFLLPNFICMP